MADNDTLTATVVQEKPIENYADDPLSVFLYALRAPETKRQYPRRLKVFLDYLGVEGNLEEQARQFLTRTKHDPQWAQSSLMHFISSQKERADLGKISPSTISNYYKATKLFIEMNIDTPVINWQLTTTPN